MTGECFCCGKPMPDDYEPEYCCSGVECGCMGMPIEPPFCSAQCEINAQIEAGFNKMAKRELEK